MAIRIALCTQFRRWRRERNRSCCAEEYELATACRAGNVERGKSSPEISASECRALVSVADLEDGRQSVQLDTCQCGAPATSTCDGVSLPGFCLLPTQTRPFPPFISDRLSTVASPPSADWFPSCPLQLPVQVVFLEFASARAVGKWCAARSLL